VICYAKPSEANNAAIERTAGRNATIYVRKCQANSACVGMNFESSSAKQIPRILPSAY
jgi:hypothetical protein